MTNRINVDKLDLIILQTMAADGDISYMELGKEFDCSGGTIHVRLKKLEEMGIVKGKRLAVDIKKLGYDVIAFIGIYLEKSSVFGSVGDELKKIGEIVRVNYTTGNYSVLAEINCKSIDHLKKILQDITNIPGVQRTETLISLEEGFNRTLQFNDIEKD